MHCKKYKNKNKQKQNKKQKTKHYESGQNNGPILTHVFTFTCLNIRENAVATCKYVYSCLIKCKSVYSLWK